MTYYRFICTYCGVVIPRERDEAPKGLCPGCYGISWERLCNQPT